MSVVQDVGRLATTMSRLAYAVQHREEWSAEMETMMREAHEALRRVAPLAAAAEQKRAPGAPAVSIDAVRPASGIGKITGPGVTGGRS